MNRGLHKTIIKPHGNVASFFLKHANTCFLKFLPCEVLWTMANLVDLESDDVTVANQKVVDKHVGASVSLMSFEPQYRLRATPTSSTQSNTSSGATSMWKRPADASSSGNNSAPDAFLAFQPSSSVMKCMTKPEALVTEPAKQNAACTFPQIVLDCYCYPNFKT